MMAENLLNRLECGEILKTFCVQGLQLKSYEIVQATEVCGFLGEYYRLILKCYESQTNCEVSYTFFVKSLPLKSAEPEKLQIFSKESRLYATLLKDLQSYSKTIWCPKSYYTRCDLLVLEDVSNIGYEKCRHDSLTLTDNELKATLCTLAAFHASTMALETCNGLNIEEHYASDMLKEITISPDISFFTVGLRTILDLAIVHPSYQSREMQFFINNRLEQRLCDIYAMVNQSKVYRNVLCHRDTWHGNILFNYTTSNLSALLVDFQTCRYCPPCIDLIFAIFLNQRMELRKIHEQYYLEWYYKALKLELSQHDIDASVCLPYEELLCSYEEFKLCGFIYRVMAATLTLVPANVVTNDYKYVDRTGPLLKILAEKATLRLCMENLIAELLEYVIVKDGNLK